MKYYVETGRVIGKNSDNLEGYSLPDKGYFPPGRLPKFEAGFFDMPMGRSEDLVMDEYRERVQELDGDGDHDHECEDDREALWDEFRAKLDDALQKRDIPVDMGMDLGG